MASAAQIAANIANAKASTGPRSPEGRAISSKNGIKLGLFTEADFIRPGEEIIYDEIKHQLRQELAPTGLLQQNLVDEIRRAMWRLRRCGEVEAHLVLILNENPVYIPDPMEGFSANAERIQASVDRARSQAHRLLHKSTAELRKLQTGRELPRTNQTQTPLDATPEAGPAAIPFPAANQTQSVATPRNSLCLCNSGLKYKRCCGRNAPPVLNSSLAA